MRVRFFIDNMLQPMYDNHIVQFFPTAELPAPPYALLMHHFRQAVFANMKGAGKVRIYDLDPEDDAQNMSVFSEGEGKDFIEGYLKKKLANFETVRGGPGERGNQ